VNFGLALTLLLLCMIPGGFLIGTLACYGYASIASMIPVIKVLFLVICVFFAISHSKNIAPTKLFGYFLLFYIVYYTYVFYYILINPEMPRDAMADVPSSNSVLYRDFVIQTLAVLIVGLYRKYINFTFFAKATVIIVAVLFCFYYPKVGYTTYGIEDAADASDLLEEQFIVSFRLARFFAIAFLCCLACKSSWFKTEKFNAILTYITATILFAGIVLTVKRGPILSMLIASLFYYLFKNKSAHTIRTMIIWGLALLLFGNYLAGFFENYMGGLVERVDVTIEDGGTGRFGSSTSVFATAQKQIEGGLLFGTYFRMISRFWYGTYPHNFILEMLMTFGIVFTSVFVPLFWKVIKRTTIIIQSGGVQALSAICFIYMFCASMTSGSVFLNTEFWIFLSMVCSYQIKKQII